MSLYFSSLSDVIYNRICCKCSFTRAVVVCIKVRYIYCVFRWCK